MLLQSELKCSLSLTLKFQKQKIKEPLHLFQIGKVYLKETNLINSFKIFLKLKREMINLIIFNTLAWRLQCRFIEIKSGALFVSERKCLALLNLLRTL